MVLDRFDIRGASVWTNSLSGAFVLSVAFHLALFAGLEIGHQLGWWRPAILPRWMAATRIRSSALLSAENRKRESIPQTQREAPLLFVEVDPAQAAAAPPKEAKYYSSHNSVAANPNPRVDSNMPRIEGTQTKVPKTTPDSRSRPVPAPPLQPAPMKPAPRPEPKTAEAAPPSNPSPPPGDLVFAKPGDSPSQPIFSDAPVTPWVRPRTLAAARQQLGMQGEKMEQEGGVKRRAVESSLDVKATPFGAYDAAIVAQIQQRWYDLLDQSDFVRGHTGKVVLEFRLTYRGRIADMVTTENTVGELLALICQKAVLDPAPFAPWPSDMRRLYGEYRPVRFTFYYE